MKNEFCFVCDIPKKENRELTLVNHQHQLRTLILTQ